MDDRGVPTTTRFRADTTVHAAGPGRYEARMDPSWWIVQGPSGGYVAAVVLRAIVAEVDDAARRPRSLTVHYLRPPAEGTVQIEVTVERAGRSVTNVAARMLQDGRSLVLALCSLALERDSPVSFDEEPALPSLPDGAPVPPAAALPRIDVDADREVPMRRHWDLRWVLGTTPFRPSPPEVERRARTAGWLRPAEDEPVDEVALAAMSDAWIPPLFCRIDEPLAVPTVDLTVHFRGLPEDPLAHCFVEFDSPLARDGYLVEHGRIRSPSGRLLAESRQLAVLA